MGESAWTATDWTLAATAWVAVITAITGGIVAIIREIAKLRGAVNEVAATQAAAADDTARLARAVNTVSVKQDAVKQALDQTKEE